MPKPVSTTRQYPTTMPCSRNIPTSKPVCLPEVSANAAWAIWQEVNAIITVHENCKNRRNASRNTTPKKTKIRQSLKRRAHRL